MPLLHELYSRSLNPSFRLPSLLALACVMASVAGCQAEPQALPTAMGSGEPVLIESPVYEASSDETTPSDEGSAPVPTANEGSAIEPTAATESSGEPEAEGSAQPTAAEPVRVEEVVTAQLVRCGTPPAPCGEGEYCARPMGECENPSVGTCSPIPMICTREFRPVCGCDGNTYANPCGAAAAGVAVAREGECQEERPMDHIAPH